VAGEVRALVLQPEVAAAVVARALQSVLAVVQARVWRRVPELAPLAVQRAARRKAAPAAHR
jgi:hypothetical protein